MDTAIHFGTPEWPGAKLDFLMGETVVPACSPALLKTHKVKKPADLLELGQEPFEALMGTQTLGASAFKVVSLDDLSPEQVQCFATKRAYPIRRPFLTLWNGLTRGRSPLDHETSRNWRTVESVQGNPGGRMYGPCVKLSTLARAHHEDGAMHFEDKNGKFFNRFCRECLR